MRRPSLGPRILRGLYIVWKKTMLNIDHGYVPFEWSRRDIADANRALRYIGLLIDWYEDKREEGEENATAEEIVS